MHVNYNSIEMKIVLLLKTYFQREKVTGTKVEEL